MIQNYNLDYNKTVLDMECLNAERRVTVLKILVTSTKTQIVFLFSNFFLTKLVKFILIVTQNNALLTII